MIKCIVVEDQQPAQRILKKYIGDVDDLELVEIFSNAITALDYLKNNQVDLIFLDIHLPKLSGMDMLSIMPQKPAVILTTAFSDYALKSYDFDVADYLLKPFSFDRFVKAVFKVKSLIEKTNSAVPVSDIQNHILVKIGRDFVKIRLNDILFVKSDGDYTEIYTPEKKYLVSFPLKYWIAELPSDNFVQVHRSYLININHIKKVSASKICSNDYNIPIGRVFKKEFRHIYLRNVEQGFVD
jgi:DNA-binding LytR/AlgR family response regulator